MFNQLLTPVADSLGLSFLVAVLPIVVVLVLLGLLRLPAWIAALAGLIVALIISIAVWQMEGDTVEEIARKLGRSERTVARKLTVIRDLWSEEAPRS